MSLLWAWVALLAATPAGAGQAWVRVETRNFQVYGHAGHLETLAISSQLEGLRAVLGEPFPELLEGPGSPPLPVIVFEDPGEFSQFVDPAWMRRSDRSEPGIRIRGARPLVAVDASRWDERVGPILDAYVDALVATRTDSPPWLRSGLSDFYAGSRLGEQSVELGAPIQDHVGVLRSGRWLKLEDIVSADASSPLLKRHRAMFEAQSWLLVHWCMLDPDGARRELLGKLMTTGRRPGDPSAQLLAELSVTGPQLTEILTTYAGSNHFGTYEVPLPPSEEALEVSVPPVEYEYRLGQVLTLGRQYERASSLFEHAMTLDEGSWMPYDGLGTIAAANLQPGVARRAFADAAVRAPTSPGPYLDHGRTAMRGLGGKIARLASRKAYERALELDPWQIDAYVGLADISYRDRDWKESARWAGRGLQVAPSDSLLRAMLGRAQYAVGDYAHARVNTQLALQHCEDHRSCSEAAAMVRGVLARLPEGG